MKISMENLHVDIGAQRVKTSISLMLIPIAGRQTVHLGCEQCGSHFLHSAQCEWLHGISYFLLLSHLLYGIGVEIFNMNKYLLSYTKTTNSIDRQHTEWDSVMSTTSSYCKRGELLYDLVHWGLPIHVSCVVNKKEKHVFVSFELLLISQSIFQLQANLACVSNVHVVR